VAAASCPGYCSASSPDLFRTKIASAVTPTPALHPEMAEVFRQKTTALAAGLEHDEQRDAARLALRGFLEKMVIPSGDALLQVVGNFGEMLAAAHGRKMSSAEAVGYVGCGGTQPTLSAALAAGSLSGSAHMCDADGGDRSDDHARPPVRLASRPRTRRTGRFHRPSRSALPP
jgi:hypothetical protein